MFIIGKCFFDIKHLHNLKTCAVSDPPILIHPLLIECPSIIVYLIGYFDYFNTRRLFKFVNKFNYCFSKFYLT